MSFEKPYDGIRVVDLSQGVAGPYCGMLLAQHGAEVIKVEPPDGDWGRLIGIRRGDHTAFSVGANLGKRGIVVDLKCDAGKAVLDKMLAQADLFIENFRPGVIERLGFDYDRVSRRNPELIYVSISGFGSTGPMRDRPAMDPMLQAFTGFMVDNKGYDGIPHRVPVVVLDMATSLYAFQAASAALYARRDATPGGRLVRTSLMQGAANLQSIRMMATIVNGAPLQTVVVPAGTFATADGWVQLVAIKDRDFVGLCKVLGLDDLHNDPRFAKGPDRVAHADEIHGRIAAAVKLRKSADLGADLAAAGVQGEALMDYFSFIEHQQSAETDLISWIPQPGSEIPWPLINLPSATPFSLESSSAIAPSLGQHTEEVLKELGYSAEEILTLHETGAVHS